MHYKQLTKTNYYSILYTMSYEFRIIKTTSKPVYYSTMVEYHKNLSLKQKEFYIVQYKHPWFFGLFNGHWKDVKYNEEEYANCYSVNIALKPYKYPALYEHLGTILPTFELAQKLLTIFKNKLNQSTVIGSDNVVYYEGKNPPSKATTNIMSEYDALIGKGKK